MSNVLMIGGKNPNGNAQAPNLDDSGNLAVSLRSNLIEVKSKVEQKNSGSVSMHFLDSDAKEIEIFVESGDIRVRTDGQPASATSGEPMGEGFAKSWDAQVISIYYKSDAVVTIIHKGQKQKVGALYHDGKEAVAWVEGSSTGTGLVTKNTDHLYLEAAQESGGAVRTFVTDVKVNMSRYNKLFVEWENDGDASPSNFSYFIVGTNKTGNYSSSSVVLQKTRNFTRTVDMLDVSNLVDELYVRVHARDGASTPTPILSKIKVFRVWGVK